ncbi:ATP-binding protein/SpoIIE family protein phosphatase [Mucilaginibacter sp. RS28]|uniref:ATP-binding protein/SpoIIE family protein phosphatase n=1 Tax=Mucilaginibacter straminoryzae TaxID=2932774 RepID=A0A9X1X6S1_9SPHI|nr:ATP-binding SpoIIE family protein phosphatase [Mucilaginibacter straminoryzae]MCJ8211180.1 ATP-binding protein/SpoIIE family protein phosphatase [Mucilaginibacter straminoryzae]
MVDATHISYPASDRSYYAILKLDIRHKAHEAGFSAQKVAEIDLVLAEMTSNLQKHAIGGEILSAVKQDEDQLYVEIICIDNGPGIADVSKVLVDGFSSTNTLGNGLGSMKRLADVLEIYSLKGWGTIILARLYKNTPTVKNRVNGIKAYPLVISKPGEKTSGDGFYFKQDKNQVVVMLADGLGHGKDANSAVNAAVDALKDATFDSPSATIRELHQAIRKSRGMVATLAFFDTERQRFEICGVGNIATKLLSTTGADKNHISYNGIIGHNIPATLNSQSYSFNEYNQLILCSDGLKSRWELSKYVNISKYDPMVLAAALYKDFSRRNDDASVVIVKLR